MHIGVLPACICVWEWWVLGPGVKIDRCELLCGCWGLNQGLLEEQPVLSITEPSLYPWQVSLPWQSTVVHSRVPQEHGGLSQEDGVAGSCLKSEKALCEDLKIQQSIAGMVNQTSIPVQRSQEDPELQACLNYGRNPVSMYRGENTCVLT